tara:strand:- start:18166 stop:19347 length:1182 start_codon:yes stop_codon:yes gene_type:complete
MNYIKIKLMPFFFFFALMPFVSPIPINTDAQPIALLLAIIIFFIDFFQKKIFLSKFEIYFLLLASFSLLFIGLHGDFEIRHRIGLLGAFFLYYAILNNFGFLSLRVLSIATVLNFLGIVWHLLDTQTFVTFAEYFMREVKIKEVAGRGVSGFAPENSFSAALSLTYILCLVYFREHKKIESLFFYVLVGLNVISIILTESGTGVIFSILLVIFGLLLQSTSKQKIIIVILSFMLPVIIFNTFLIDTRGGSLLFFVLQNPSYLFIDSSLQERWIGMHVGIVSLYEYPFGIGGGGYQFAAEKIESIYGLREIYPFARWTSETTNSAFGRYLTEFGVFFLIWFIVIVYRSFSKHPNSGRSTLLASLYILASFSIAFPPTYLLFALAFNSKMRGSLK